MLLKVYAPALILSVGYLFVSNTRGQKAVELVAPIQGVMPSVEGYQSATKKISDDERRVAAMTDYVIRAYSLDSVMAFTTLVAYYDRQTRGKSIHSPRNCLPGAGWEVLSGATQVVTVGGSRHTINEYVLKKGHSRAVVYYWYQGRGRVVASEYAVKWNLLRDAVLRGHTEEALVRVVVPVGELSQRLTSHGDQKLSEASALGKTIAARMIPEVDRVLPGQHDRG